MDSNLSLQLVSLHLDVTASHVSSCMQARIQLLGPWGVPAHELSYFEDPTEVGADHNSSILPEWQRRQGAARREHTRRSSVALYMPAFDAAEMADIAMKVSHGPQAEDMCVLWMRVLGLHLVAWPCPLDTRLHDSLPPASDLLWSCCSQDSSGYQRSPECVFLSTILGPVPLAFLDATVMVIMFHCFLAVAR